MIYYNTLFQLQNYKIKMIHTYCISVSKTHNQSMIIIFIMTTDLQKKERKRITLERDREGPRFAKVEWKRR